MRILLLAAVPMAAAVVAVMDTNIIVAQPVFVSHFKHTFVGYSWTL